MKSAMSKAKRPVTRQEEILELPSQRANLLNEANLEVKANDQQPNRKWAKDMRVHRKRNADDRHMKDV